MKKFKTVLKLFLFLVIQLLFFSSGTDTNALKTNSLTPLPFACSNASIKTEGVSMSGKSYTDAVMFTMGYTGLPNGYTAQITYNFKGAYESLSFDAGFVSGHKRNANLTIIADEKVICDSETIVYSNIAKSYTVSLKGVSKLTIRFVSESYDKTNYAIGGVMAVPTAEPPSDTALDSDEFYDIPRYLLQNAKVINDEFSMGGYNYKNGYLMQMGYNGNINGTNNGYTSKVSFNFDKKYKKLSFDIAKCVKRSSESYTRSAFLTIEIDGQVLTSYKERELKWDDLSIPITIDLTGVSQVTITTVSNGYDNVWWAIGNIQLESDKHAHGILLSTDKATLTPSSSVIDLKPRVYPSDAENKNFTISSDSSIIAAVSKNGVVIGRHYGDVTITAITEDGNHVATCKIKSDLYSNPKYVPSKDGWGFTNIDLDLLGEDGLLSGYYDDIYKQISGNSFLYNNSLVEYLKKYNNTMISDTLSLSSIANGFDFIWYSFMANSSLGGLCYGYAVSSALTFTGDIPFDNWKWEKGNTYDTPCEIVELKEYDGYSSDLDLYLKQMIYGFHISQGSLSYFTSKWNTKNHYNDIINATANFYETGKDPIVLILESHNYGGHAVLPYEVIENDNEIYMFVYDPNHHNNNDPDTVCIQFTKNEKGEIVDWIFNNNYQMSNADISFIDSLSIYADRMKNKEKLDSITKTVFTTAKNFSVLKNNETLLNYSNGVFNGDTDQSIIVPFELSCSNGNVENYSGSAFAILEDADIRIVLSDGDTQSTTIYYTPDYACLIECDNDAEIVITSENVNNIMNIKPSQQGNVTIRYNTENSSVISHGNVPNDLCVNTNGKDNTVSFKGYSTIQATLLIDDSEIIGENTIVSPNETYLISQDATVYSTNNGQLGENDKILQNNTDNNSKNDTSDNKYYVLIIAVLIGIIVLLVICIVVLIILLKKKSKSIK